MTYWKATVDKPDGAGGWITVGVFGTPETPGQSTARYLSATSAVEAIKTVFRHVWPIDLYEYNKRSDPAKWQDREDAHTGIADHRITVEVNESDRWSVGYDKPLPEPLTMTVGELRLAEIREQVAATAEAKTRVKELTRQLAVARGDARHHAWRREESMRDAVRAGVPEQDVAKAARMPRPRGKKPTTRGPGETNLPSQ